MLRPLVLLGLIMLGLAACTILPVASLAPNAEAERRADSSVMPAPQGLPSSEPCAVTPPIQAEPPDDPNADPFGFGPWVVNGERTIWVGLRTDGGWRTGGEKVLWIRPAGTELVVSGQQLDGDAPPLRAEIPCCYLTGFQVTGLHFPSEGCWAVTANAGAHELRFITQVRAGDKAN